MDINLREILEENPRGYNLREDAPLILADYVSHEGERVKVVSRSVIGEGILDLSSLLPGRNSTDLDEIRSFYVDCVTCVYANEGEVARYNSADLPEEWIPRIQGKIKELSQARASAVEMASALETMIADLSEQDLYENPPRTPIWDNSDLSFSWEDIGYFDD